MSKTKRFLSRGMTFVVAFMAALLLASCYWNPQNGAGMFTLNLRSSTRTQVDPTTVQYARIYLYADNMNSRINIGDGTAYAETTMSPSGGSVTVDHVPAGTGYQIVLTLGSKPNGTTFVPGQFGESGIFSVTASRNTEVDISSMLTVSSFNSNSLVDYQDLGKDFNSVAVMSGYQELGVTDSRNLYIANYSLFGSNGQGLVPGNQLPTGDTINSVNVAIGPSGIYPYFFVNTTHGIVPFDTSGAVATSSITQLNNSTAPTGNVLSSGSYTSTNPYVIYSKKAQGLTGVVASGNWVNVTLSNDPESLPVLDFALPTFATTPSDFGYFATSVGAFKIDYSLVQTTNHDISFVNSSANAGFFYVPDATGKNLLITSLALDNLGNLLVGTDDGVYSIPEASISVGPGKTTPISRNTEIPGTEGHPIRKVMFGAYGINGLVAALSNNLIILYDGTAHFDLPLSAIGLGSVNAVSLDPGGAYIAFAGTEGLTVFIFDPSLLG